MPYTIVSEFEKKIAEFAGSKYAVAVDSCTNALFLCCKYLKVNKITIPSKTYVSVPCAIIHAGGVVAFEDVNWSQKYQLKPYPIYDAAGEFHKNMYVENSYFCISFSATKPINIGKGGMILTNDEQAKDWFKLARYMGRHEIPLKEDKIEVLGWNMYMTPEQAARGLLLLLSPRKCPTVCSNNYPDISKFNIYKAT
jgi:dTDP-4-amino-4,6-dideoxygalactose transaminase